MPFRAELEALRGKPSMINTWMRFGPMGFKGYQLSTSDYQYRGDPATEGPGDVVSSAVRTENVDTAFPHGRHNQFADAGIGERVITTAVITKPRFTHAPTTRAVIKRNLLGRQKRVLEPVIERVELPPEPLSVGDFDGTGNKEPAFAVGYDLLGRADKLSGVMLDAASRSCTLTVAIVMAESEALELTERLMDQPKAARQYGEFVLRGMQQIREDAVSSPNYALLDQHVGLMQFATNVEQSETEGIILPFR